MKRIWFSPIISFVTVVQIVFWTLYSAGTPIVLAQQPTDTSLPGSASTGMFITVITDEPQINVRMGPSSSIYPIVGILLRSATAPALGRSLGGDWIQIEYAGAPNNVGWVYSPLVQVSPGTLRIVEPPPTPIPPATATIDPTLAAQFVIVATNTRLPTFTPPPSVTPVIYTEFPLTEGQGSVPIAAIIIALAVLGVIGFFLSLLIRR